MAGKAIPVRVGDAVILVEASPMAGSEHTSTRATKAADGAIEAFDAVKGTIVDLAVATVRVIEAAAERAARPDHVEITFGLKVTVEGKVIVAGASAEGSIEVKLTYDTPGRGG